MTETTSLVPLVFLLALVAAAAAGLGAVLAAARARSREQAMRDRTAADQAAWQHERASLATAQARLEGQLTAETASHAKAREELDWQRKQNGALESKMAPMREALDTLTRNMHDTERARVRSQTELVQQVTDMSRRFTEATADVRHEARKLSQVLSRSEHRGAWGEMQLRTLVESAGMLPHVHFVEQDHNATESGALRPDMVVDLAGGRHVVVDAKVPLDAFLRMDADASADETRTRHAQAVAQHIQRLGGKEYWRQYDSPEFVVMFVPSEGLLSAALEVRPDLLQLGLDRKVILATPTTLLSMLHAISHAWRQVAAAEQAREIQRAGAEFYSRILTMATKLDQLGRAITKSVDAYDATLSTLESRVLPSGRRMEKLSVAEAPIPDLEPLDSATKKLNPAKWGLDTTTDIDSPPPADGPPDELEAVAPEPAVVDPQVASGPSRRPRGRHSAA